MLGFSPLAGAPLASTGDASESVTVSINADTGIVRSSNNLATPLLRAVVGFEPEETLFDVVVNGRKLGDIDNNGSVNVNDVSNALQWEAGTSSAAVTAYIEGPMTTYMLANLAAYQGINIAFTSVEMSGVVGTGVTVEIDQTVDVNNRLQIAQVPDNLAVGIGAAIGGQQPEATLFNTVVNGRKLGDINDDGSVNTQDLFIAQKWDSANATLPLADARYISGPMNDYMIANFSSFGPAGIGLIFNSPTGVGAVGTGVTVETDQTVDVNNIGITAAGVVGTGVTVETDQTVDVNNLGITATGVVNDVTVTGGAGVTVSLNNTGITATGVVGTVLIWSSIIPNQSPNFSPITPSQTPSFAPISPAQSASFAEIVPSQTSSWTPINPAPSTSWAKIQAA